MGYVILVAMTIIGLAAYLTVGTPAYEAMSDKFWYVMLFPLVYLFGYALLRD